MCFEKFMSLEEKAYQTRAKRKRVCGPFFNRDYILGRPPKKPKNEDRDQDF